MSNHDEQCRGYCQGLKDEVESLKNQQDKNGPLVAHAIFKVGHALVAALEDLTNQVERVANEIKDRGIPF